MRVVLSRSFEVEINGDRHHALLPAADLVSRSLSTCLIARYQKVLVLPATDPASLCLRICLTHTYFSIT